MKKETKIIFLLALFCLISGLVIELTSPTSLYRDPYMFRHFSAAEFIKEKNKADTIGEKFEAIRFSGWSFLRNENTTNFYFFDRFFSKKNLIFFTIPVLSAAIFNFLSGLDLYFLFNHFYFLIFIAALAFFVLFREIFRKDILALTLSLLVVLFPFEPLYYKISIHGWFFVRIFGAMSLYFLVKFLKQGFSFKSKNLFLLLFFSVLSVYSDKSAFALSILPLLLFFLIYFFFKKKEIKVKQIHLNSFLLIFLLLLVFSFVNILNQISWNIGALIYNFSEMNFLPSFLFPNLPFSEYYLEKDFSYSILRYFIPFFVVLSLLIFNFNKIKSFILKNNLIKSFIFSQAILYSIIGLFMLFSFAFISNRGASMIFFFLSILCLIGLNEMKTSFLKHSFLAVFFVFVLLIPFVFFTQTPQYKYEQFNEKHLNSIQWIKENLNEKSRIYSDVKMAKAVGLKTGLSVVNAKLEFGDYMENEIIPIYFDSNIFQAVLRLNQYEATHLLLTKDMDSLMVQPANELMKPATHLRKFNDSNSFDKIFENKETRIYEIN